MNHFELRDGELACEAVPLARIAEAVGTPVYVYSSATLARHFQVFRDAVRGLGQPEPLIAYAVKANSNLSVLKVLGDLGAGADTVSEGEIRRALAAGIPPRRIIFSGVGKLEHEIEFALEIGVSEINIESEPELELVARVAARLGTRATVALRINPDVSAGAHDKISTGKASSKFGIAMAEAERVYAKASNNAHLRVAGVACHIGSQIGDLASIEEEAVKMRGLVERLRGEGFAVERLDLGGGLGVPYFNQPEPPGPDRYAAVLARVLDGLDISLSFEPGRVIAANAGVLLSRVTHVNLRPDGRRFLVLDAAMNDLIRPAMYDASPRRPPGPRAGCGGRLSNPMTWSARSARDRRHLRARPDAAAAGRGRPGRLHVSRGLWGGDGQRIQQPPPGPRGPGPRRPVRHRPLPAPPTTRCWPPNPSRPGSEKTSPKGRGRLPRGQRSGRVRGYGFDGLAQRTFRMRCIGVRFGEAVTPHPPIRFALGPSLSLWERSF